MTPHNETIFALSSGRPPAAIAMVRLSGPQAVEAATAIAGSLPEERRAAVRTLRHPETDEPLDSALVLHFAGPLTATGEDIVEFHCHGGRAVVAAVLDALGSIEGLRAAEPGEFTRRALFNGRIDLTEAEGLADLLAAETEQQRRAALPSAGGELRRRIEQWRERVVDLSAQAEAAIDYVGDEDETALDPLVLVQGARDIADEIETLLARPVVDPLREGIRVVIAGPPNAGKSSLINALTQSDRAIVTPIAGTTRDVIEVPVAIAGIPFTLVDTAGLRETMDPVESIGIDYARRELDRADIILWLGSDDAYFAAPSLRVQTKGDLGRERRSSARHHVSSVTGSGIAELVEEIVGMAGDIFPDPDELSLNTRQHRELTAVRDALSVQATDLVIVAHQLQTAISAFNRLTGREGIEDVLDALFGRFCLGK